MIVNEATGKQIKWIKGIIDSIQTTSQATLSQAGWYRVAEYKTSTTAQSNGAFSNACIVAIKVATGGEGVFVLGSKVNAQEISPFEITGLTGISKIRYVVDSNTLTAYIEVYATGAISALCNLLNVSDFAYRWNALDFIATSETVSGVTVTTTYDIPANAKPVTDLDIAEAIAEFNLGVVNILESEVGTIPAIYDIPSHRTYIATISPKITTDNTYLFSGTVWTLVGMHYNNMTYGYQMGFGSDGQIKLRRLHNGTWQDWIAITKQSDLTTALAGYLPKTGGKLTNNLEIASTIAEMRRLIFSNSVGMGWIGVDEDGYIRLVNTKANHKEVFTSKPDGTNTFNGSSNLLQGLQINLPLTERYGVGTVKYRYALNKDYATDIFPVLDNSNAVLQLNRHADTSGGYTSQLGFSSDGNIYYRATSTGTWRKILDSANFDDYALALNGGKITSGMTTPLQINSTSSDAFVLVQMLKNGVSQGSYGFYGADNPVIMDTSYNLRSLLHTGNLADHAVPKTGGKITGNLEFTGATSTISGLQALKALTADIERSLTVGGNAVLHAGNSAKVVVSETPLTAEGSVRVW